MRCWRCSRSPLPILGQTAPRQRRRAVTLVLVAKVVVIAAVMVAIAVTVYLLTN
jgi:hypothetical protein